MAEDSKKSNIKQEYNVAAKGLNLDSSQNNIDKGILSYALNAAMENFDANSFQYQNEPGNQPCFDFPDGFHLLGKYFIPEKTKILFWLKNDETGESEIGYMVNNDCVYRTLVNDDCLNFDINRPILSGAHRILDNGDVEIYWADNNGRRFLNLNKIPYIPLSSSKTCDEKDSNRLDCNSILLQPDLNIPITQVNDVISGGEITSGTYQFTVQYADADGNPYTAYYNVTNPLPIADVETATVNFDIPVGKSIVVDIKNLNQLGTYDYFNLAVIKTVNNIPSVELVGTYFIDSYSKQIIYTGQNKTNIRLTINDIFEKFAFYEGADHVTAVQDILVWKGVKPAERISYQKIANNIKLKWQTHRLPPSDGGYANEINASNFRSYLRDEVYAFELVLLLQNGKETDAFHIPGRSLEASETAYPDIEIDNPDYIGDGKSKSKYWEVYNTAEVEGFSEEFKDATADETVVVDYCTYELRQGGPDPLLGKVFEVNYTDLNGIQQVVSVESEVQYIDSTVTPNIASGQGYINEISCDSVVNTNITEAIKEYKGPYEYGKFAYWESTEEYPCDTGIWGDLAGEKIRHHKFPDCRISPIIDNTLLDGSPVMEDVAIFPIGVLIDTDAVELLIEQSDLTTQQKEDIVGYKITRADRGVNKSIVAKGMLRNVNKYTREDQDFIYPNYPYNDVNKDPFLISSNNAWSQLSEEYTLEIYNLPEQEDGEHYVEIEYIDKNTNKIKTKKFSKTGVEYICSIGKPVFISLGDYNKSTEPHVFPNDFEDAFTEYWEQYAPKPDTSVDANIYPSNYDVWQINWDNFTLGASGMKPQWNDYIEDDEKYKYLTYRNEIIVKTIVGFPPTCTLDSCKKSGGADKMNEPKLIAEVRKESLCTKAESIEPISSSSELLNRQIFNSPETSFGQPFLGNILSLETVMYGGGKAHFVEVKDNAKYQLLSEEAQRDALKAAYDIGKITSTLNVEAMFAVYNAQLEIWRNDITKRNFARSFNSIASYNYADPVPINLGIKNRNLDIKRYLISEVLNVGEEDLNVNNYNREGSVYLRATETIPLPDSVLETYHNVTLKDNSRFTISDKGNCSTPEKEEDISVVSYYGSLKNRFVNQYGQIYSYESIDTGFVKIFDNPEATGNTIWGGDTFIGKFAYKTKLPFFIDNRVGSPDDADIFYDEIGNVAYPKYWHSSRSILETYSDNDLKLTDFVSYKATNFDCPNDKLRGPAPEDFDYENDDPSNYPSRTYLDGYYYLFAYGVPSFYCESSYNLDLRTAFNNREGDFWPHVSSGIPDNWLQETNVPIIQDNTYNYNVTFSKQNKESVITNLPANWDENNEINYYPFRAVYSDKQISNVNNRLNNWLIYRPLSYFDFPQNYGNLTALDSLQNAAILARFENKSLLYNSLVTIDTSNPQAAYVGNPNLFANQPIDFGDTDQGYVGSQNKFLLKTPYGAVSVDAKRGHVFLINGKQAQDLTQYGSGMQRWFTAHLPFEISKYFNEINTDNHFKDIGLHGVFDSNYERIIITKLDYIPLDKNIEFRDGLFYITKNGIEKEVFLIDSDYFCNVSWTISFNFNSKSWVSFHSYIPNWYVGENNFFYSGLNYCSNDFDMLVGVKDLTLPSTTTTTTLPLTTTTSTTIFVQPSDCSFTASVSLTSCEIEGNGVFVDGPIIPPCKRPADLEDGVLYKGYTLSGIEYDSTPSQSLACTALSYYLIKEGLLDYQPSNISVKWEELVLNSLVFDDNGTTDCTSIPDGWYFTSESAEIDNTVFQIVNGKVASIQECGAITDPTTTTTTTTSNIVTTTQCFSGVYPENDPLHPLGGVVNYLDENGDSQTITNIWVTSQVQITYSDIVSITDVNIVPCTVLYGISLGSSQVSSALSAQASISGNIYGSSDIDGVINGIAPILGVSNGVATILGKLNYGATNGDANSDGSSNVSGFLQGIAEIFAESNSIATVTGILTANGSLSGTSDGSTTIIAFMGLTAQLEGEVFPEANPVATLTGVLTGVQYPCADCGLYLE